MGTYNGVTNPAFTYDNDGNMLSGAGRTMSYMSFSQPSSIAQGTMSAALAYDAYHQHYKMCIPNCTSPTATTYYMKDPMTGMYSERVVSGSTTTWNDYVIVPGAGIVALRMKTGGTVLWRYAGVDHLGSVSTLTDAGAGAVAERDSYDSRGKRRNADGSDNTTCSITSQVDRGFTGHEMLDSLCLINMNARVYDPSLGRFMAADSIVPNAMNTQDHNRYSYVHDNPLAFTDPTGHSDPFEWYNLTAPQIETAPGWGWRQYNFGAISWGDGGGGYPGGAPYGGNEEGGGGGGSDKGPSSCDQTLVAIGNYIEDLSQKAGDASGAVVVGGAAVTAVGAGASAVGAPEVGGPVAGAGITMMDTGGIGGYGAGALQFVGGIFQGLGGARYSNTFNASATVGTSAMLAGAAKAATSGLNSASGRALANIISTQSAITGAGYDVLVNQIKQLAPQQKSCPGH